MPIIDTAQTNQQVTDRVEAPPFVQRDIETSTVVKDFLKTENGLFNAADGLGNLLFNRFEPDVDYEPDDDMFGYEGYAVNLMGARSKEHMSFLKSQIDKENKQRENFAIGSGWQKAAGIAALIATDPLTLAPVGGSVVRATKTGTVIENGLRTAGVVAATEIANEAMLQANQITRTEEEGFYNVGAATIVGGLLGSATSVLSKTELDDLTKKFSADLKFSSDIAEGATNDLSTAGAMQVATTGFQEEIKGLKKTQKVVKNLPPFLKNPVFETATSPSKAVRQFSEKLADLSLVKNKNSEFIASEASIESLVKSYDSLRVPFYKAENDLYKAYRQRVKSEGVPFDQKMGSKKDGSLTRQEFNEQVWHAGINNDTHIIPEIAELAKAARRDVFDPILKRSEEVGIFKNIDEIDVKTADSWMKRMYDRDKIINNRNEFKQIVLDDLSEGIEARKLEIEKLKQAEQTKENIKKIKDLEYKLEVSVEQLDDTAEQLIDRITNTTAGRLPYDLKLEGRAKGPQKVGARGSAKQRVWNIKDEKIQDYLVKDVRAIVESHIRTMAPDNEIMGKFGTLDFDPIKKQIQEDYNKLRYQKVKDKKTGVERAKNNKELAALDKQMTSDIKNLKAMHDKLRGIYAQPDDYTAPQHVLERAALGFNFSRLLGDVMASSVPDLARPIMVHGFGRTYGKLFKTLMSDFKGLKMSIDEMKEIGLALDATTAMTTLRRMNMDEFTPSAGKIDDFTNKSTAFFSLASGMNHWTAVMKTLTGTMTQNRMLEGIIEFAETGKLARKEVENLASHFIDRDMAKKIAAEFKKHGETREVLRIANARDWEDATARNLFRTAVRKQVDEIIVTPGLDKPLWMSRPGWRTVGQFKSFSFASTQRVLMAGMQQADANYFAGMSSMVLLGSLVYAYKTKMAGRETSDDPRVWIAEGIDRSGITGITMDVNNIIEKATRGRVGINALVGGPPMSRYASRNVTGAILGPSFGLAQDVFQTTGAIAAGEVGPSDARAIRRLMPGQNLPYIRKLFDEAEEGINATLGTE